MSELENTSAPIIKKMILKDEKITLSSRDIFKVAAVTFKNSVIADHVQNYRPPYFTFKERRLFAETLEIPFGVQLWLGSKANLDGLYKSYYTCTPTGTPNGFEALVFTYGIGHFLIQCTSARPTRKIRRRYAAPRPFTQDWIWNSDIVPFWPCDVSSIVWPYGSHFGDLLVDKFVHRWEERINIAV
jgi:hypothetical protein